MEKVRLFAFGRRDELFPQGEIETMAKAVFQADLQTRTGAAVPAAGADNHIPTMGSDADWGAIASAEFLSGPQPGQEQTLVKVGNQSAQIAEGERIHDVQKDATTHVHQGDNKLYYDKNREIEIALDDKITVSGNNKIEVHGDRNVDVIQNLNEYAKLKIKLTAGVELTLEGPGGMIKIDSTGVTIQGVLVKIN
jgi:hypothetical protein